MLRNYLYKYQLTLQIYDKNRKARTFAELIKVKFETFPYILNSKVDNFDLFFTFWEHNKKKKR